MPTKNVDYSILIFFSLKNFLKIILKIFVNLSEFNDFLEAFIIVNSFSSISISYEE